uniref:Uncharacterized protein n=1 Tax=Nelumbo nucifera TaxID=4432 RepID=A0A822XYA4_NELNU|nr:TPA_asm: hypothetical protein HUJ06_025644 [Nelumbo nucifera]DAD24184.1 TPA_asm: hypothetical protein HUJ06_025647 [Nelumbo nucifera]
MTSRKNNLEFCLLQYKYRNKVLNKIKRLENLEKTQRIISK